MLRRVLIAHRQDSDDGPEELEESLDKGNERDGDGGGYDETDDKNDRDLGVGYDTFNAAKRYRV